MPYVYQFLGKVLPQILGIGISSVIIKNAGADVFGQYSLLLAAVTIVFGVAGSALDTDFQRTCDPSRLGKVLSTKLFVFIALLPTFYLIAWVADINWGLVLLAALAIFLQQFIETGVTRDRILGNDRQTIMPRLLPVLLFLSALLVFQPNNLFNIALMLVASWVVGLCFIFPLMRVVRISGKVSLRLLRQISPIWFSLLLTQVYGNIDLYIVRIFHGDEVVGIYKVAFSFAAMAVPLAGVFSYIFLSKISVAIKNQEYELAKATLLNQLVICGVLGSGVMLFMAYLFPFIAEQLYGPAAEEMVVPARLLAVAMVFNMLTMVFSYGLLAFRMEKMIALMTAIGAFFYLGFGFPLIRIYGAEGAGVAMSITYGFLLLAYILIFNKRFSYERSRKSGALSAVGSDNPAGKKS